MRLAGRLKLGFYPLPAREAERLGACLDCPDPFSALDPCAGDGAAFVHLLKGKPASVYGIELDSGRAQEARARGLQLVHGSTFEVRCAAECFSLLYLNPPYDYETGESGNQRLERRFLEHTFRWLKMKGVLALVLPRRLLSACARLLAKHFTEIRVFALSEAECRRFAQIAVLAVRCGRPAGGFVIAGHRAGTRGGCRRRADSYSGKCSGRALPRASLGCGGSTQPGSAAGRARRSAAPLGGVPAGQWRRVRTHSSSELQRSLFDE
jgi:hypothetical protein